LILLCRRPVILKWYATFDGNLKVEVSWNFKWIWKQN
jgi:hypothetical protein